MEDVFCLLLLFLFFSVLVRDKESIFILKCLAGSMSKRGKDKQNLNGCRKFGLFIMLNQYASTFIFSSALMICIFAFLMLKCLLLKTKIWKDFLCFN